MAKKQNRGKSRKAVNDVVCDVDGWRIVEGRLVPSRGRPRKTTHLFRYVAEKLPFGCLGKVKRNLAANADGLEGVYMAHDSMGVARYGGRGQIFTRLAAHRKAYPRELLYFSFYVIANKAHEREIETAILRAASSQMILNTRKVRSGLETGNVSDYEPGTKFFERQSMPGRRRKPGGRRR
jgi:hypothetical protein